MPNQPTRDIQNLMQGARLTLPQARALMEDPPAHLSDKQKRKLKAWVEARETEARSKHRDRYKAATELLTQRREDMTEEIATLQEYVAEVKQGLETGRITSDKGQEALTAAFREIKKLRERIEGTRTDEERAWNMINADPADVERERMTRFPHLADTLPHVTPADLDGS